MILWMDDEAHRIEPVVMQLERKGHQVQLVGSANEALELLRSPPPELQAFVWDLYLPAASSPWSARETDFGTRTGLLVYDTMRRQAPELPAVLYTNARDDDLFDSLRPPRDRALSKASAGGDELAAALEALGVRPTPAPTPREGAE